ncbi:MAG: hypothetical protein R3C45_19395 [Phycisphaerales bacterium]
MLPCLPRPSTSVLSPSVRTILWLSSPGRARRRAKNSASPSARRSRARFRCKELGLPYIFKASFDKANRSSIHTDRGPGMDAGLALLSKVRDKLGVPITTDLHEPTQAQAVGKVVDLIQIPRFFAGRPTCLSPPRRPA